VENPYHLAKYMKDLGGILIARGVANIWVEIEETSEYTTRYRLSFLYNCYSARSVMYLKCVFLLSCEKNLFLLTTAEKGDDFRG